MVIGELARLSLPVPGTLSVPGYLYVCNIPCRAWMGARTDVA